MSGIRLYGFIPKGAYYQIWHPKNLLIDESDDGVVSFTSPETDSTLTLSTYTADKKVTESIL